MSQLQPLKIPANFHWRPLFVVRLALARDIYHKLKAKCDEARPKARPFAAGTVRAVASNAWRCLGAL